MASQGISISSILMAKCPEENFLDRWNVEFILETLDRSCSSFNLAAAGHEFVQSRPFYLGFPNMFVSSEELEGRLWD